MTRIDLNSDLGEGAGTDEAIMPHVTSANVACGAHAGDADTMRRTIALALAHAVAVGAHPGYRDPANFGRLPLDLPDDVLEHDLRLQIETLRALARRAGAALAHVKAHGALYNRAEREERTAGVIAAAVRSVDPALLLFAPPGSALERAAAAAGLRVAREGFVDRAYEPDGTLRSRRLDGALHTDPAVAAAQAVSLARDGTVRASDGTVLDLQVDTLCLHGDTPNAPLIARAVRRALAEAEVTVRAIGA
ncbi:MAG: LamB/YcsF family protein [Candidatus Limnocylindria bacterium]